MASLLVQKGLRLAFKKAVGMGLHVAMSVDAESSAEFDFGTGTADVTSVPSPPFNGVVLKTSISKVTKDTRAITTTEVMIEAVNADFLTNLCQVTFDGQSWRYVSAKEASKYIHIIVLTREGS